MFGPGFDGAFLAASGGLCCGPSSPWERPHDGGGALRDTAYSREAEALARRHGRNPKTVAKWRARASVADQRAPAPRTHARPCPRPRRTKPPPSPSGATRSCRSTNEATIPQLTRSFLHRCLQRHGISRHPKGTATSRSAPGSSANPIGSFHRDIAEVRTDCGPLVASEHSVATPSSV